MDVMKGFDYPCFSFIKYLYITIPTCRQQIAVALTNIDPESPAYKKEMPIELNHKNYKNETNKCQVDTNEKRINHSLV